MKYKKRSAITPPERRATGNAAQPKCEANPHIAENCSGSLGDTIRRLFGLSEQKQANVKPRTTGRAIFEGRLFRAAKMDLIGGKAGKGLKETMPPKCSPRCQDADQTQRKEKKR